LLALPPQAKEAELKLARDAAALAETKGALDAASVVLAQRGAEAYASARQNQGLVKEMGVLASR
jgi:hypothetical protein